MRASWSPSSPGECLTLFFAPSTRMRSARCRDRGRSTALAGRRVDGGDELLEFCAVGVQVVIFIEAALGALAPEDVDDGLTLLAGQLPHVVDAPELRRNVGREALEHREKAALRPVGVVHRVRSRAGEVRRPTPPAPSSVARSSSASPAGP